MKTKEVRQRIRQIEQYEWELYNSQASGLDIDLIEGLEMSKRNTKVKFCTLVRRMQENGLWMDYLENSYNVNMRSRSKETLE